MARKRNIRNITKFKGSIKAISPVIATLLMIAIAVVASLVVYAWVSGYLGFQTDKAGKAVQVPSFAVDDVTKDMIIYVQNIGQGTVQVGAVYIDDQQVADFSAVTSKQIGEGSTVELPINDKDYDSNTRYDIKVTTTDGTFITVSGKPGTGGSAGNPSVQYTVTFALGANSAGATITPSAGDYTYNEGQDVAISATAASGYHFDEWTTTGSIAFDNANSASTTATINGAGTITANFEQDTFSYSTTTTLNAITTPLTPSQTGVAFSGSVSASTTVPNGVQVVLQYSTSTSGPWTTATNVNTASGTGAFSGTFTAPTTAGTYYYQAYFAEYTSGANTWQTSTSSQHTVVVSASVSPHYINQVVSGYTPIGTHDVFADMQGAADSNYDTLNEADTLSSYWTDAALDLRVEFTGVSNYASYNRIGIRTGSWQTSEDLIVQYWTGSTWSNLDFDSGAGTRNYLNEDTLNSAVVSLSSNTFRIRFIDESPTDDNLSYWNIDSVYLYKA